MNFGKEVKTGSAGCGNYETGSCGWEISRADKVRDSLGDHGLVLPGGVMVQGEIGGGVSEWSLCFRYVKIGTPDDNCPPPPISGFDSEVGIVAEGVECRAFQGGKVRVGTRGGEVEAVDVPTAIENK